MLYNCIIRHVKRNDMTFSSTIQELRDNEMYIAEDSIFYELYHTHEDNIKELALYYENEELVSVALTWTFPCRYNILGDHIGCFTKPEHRRKRYGSAVVQKLYCGQSWLEGEPNTSGFWIEQ